MNTVLLIGRLTRDTDCKFGSDTSKSICRFTVAIDRGKDRNGNDLGADFPTVICFGKTAENCGKYIAKGSLVGIDGKIRTGSYEKDGTKVYTTEVLADRVEFLDKRKQKEETDDNVQVEGFARFNDDSDLPF